VLSDPGYGVLGERDRAGLDAGYDAFARLNVELKQICTRWQVRDAEVVPMRLNDHTDRSYDDEVLQRLVRVHTGVRQWLATAGSVLPRSAEHAGALAAALDAARAGDPQMVTGLSPRSYHSVWMVLHDEVLTALGRERSEEDA
jgi:hypothetical protein